MRRLVCTTILLTALTTNGAAQEARKAIFKPAPHYPVIARQMNLVGTVKVEVTIGADGRVKNTNVIGGHPVLIAPTLEAVKEWKYEPSKTETTVTLTFDFRP
jgi:protein TonB